MKRLQKLMSFVLVLSLLFTSLVFTTSAAEEDEYYVDENAELFQPTAHYTAITETNVLNILNSLLADGSQTTTFVPSAIYGGSNVNAYIVSSSGMEEYVMIVPTKTAVQNGKVNDHVQINTHVKENIKYDAENPSYYIFEMDVATESGVLPLYHQTVARNPDQVKVNGTVVDAWGSAWYPHHTANSLYMTMTPGVFHHVTFLSDIDNNVMYIYIDNQLAATHTNAVTSAAMLDQYKNSGATLQIEGFRIQLNSGIKINGNMSYCFKDMYENVLTGTESGNLSDYAGKPTLHGWDGNRYEGHTDNKLPALININGVDYNNTVDASNALNSYKENNEAELLRSVFSGDITVDCDALIHTYSTDVSLSEGPHTTLTKVDGSTWQAKLHTDKYSAELVLSNPALNKNLSEYLKYDLDGNLISEININNAGQVPGVNADIMQSDRNNRYLYVYDNSEDAYNTANHFYLNASMPHTANNAIKGHDFIVFDFDIYSETELINVYNGFVPRSLTQITKPDGTKSYPPLSATSFFLTSNLTGTNYIRIESGIWNHFTFVGDVATGYAYVYINNELVASIKDGLYTKSTNANGETVALDASKNEYTLDDVTINSFRCMQIAAGVSGTSLTQNMSICADNFDARFVDGDHTLVAGMDNLSGWVSNLYGNGYQFEELPAIAAVDGVEYYDTYSLTEALTPKYPTTVSKKVVLLREFKGNFTVNCNATIEARGFESHITLGTECSDGNNTDEKITVDANGIVTVTCPLASSVDVNKFDNNLISDGNDYKSGVAGNRVWGIETGNNTNSTFIDINKATPYGSTDHYIAVECNTTTSYKGSSNNLFINVSTPASDPFTVVGDGAKGYYVIDLDVSCAGNMLPGFDVSVVHRRVSDGKGYPFSDEIFIGNFFKGDDEWAHVTIVGDIKNNDAKVYVNGIYVGSAGRAVRNEAGAVTNDQPNGSWLGTDTQVKAHGFRVELTRNNIQTDMTKGDNVSFDNFAHRLFVNDDYAELADAIATGDLSGWSGYTAGRSGELVSYIAIVDGVPYASQTDIELALTGEKTANVEIISSNLTDLQVNCNAVINTNGFTVNITHGSDFTSETNGNTVTVSGHFVENLQSIETTDKTAIKEAIRYDHADNIFNTFTTNSSKVWGADGSRKSELITDTDNGNVYYKESMFGDSITATNDYVQTNFSTKTLKYVEGSTEYVVLDYDLMFEANGGALEQYIIVRGLNTGSSFGVRTPFQNWDLEAGKFNHVTIVFNFTDGYSYTFINGKLAHKNAKGALCDAAMTAYKANTTGTVSEIRIGSNSKSIYHLDNVLIRYASYTNDADTLATATTSGNIRAWSENIYNDTYEMASTPAIATINGVKYSYHDDIQTLLDKVDVADMEFHRLDDETYTFSSPATVKTNGLAISYEVDNGYQSSFDNSENILTVSSTGEGTLTLNIGGVQVLNKKLPHGTDIRALLTEYGFGAASKTIACDGMIYTGVTWTASNQANMDSSTGTPTGYLNSDLTLSATGGSVFNKPFVLLDANGAIVDNDYSSTALMNFFLTQPNGSIILGSDWSVENGTTAENKKSNYITATTGTMNVCLNGYSIIDATSGTDHPFRIEDRGTHNINFYGDGTFEFNVHTSSRSIIYTSYYYTGKITFKNLDIDTSYTILYLRSGNGELIGCDVDAYLVNVAQNGLFFLGQNYTNETGNTGFSTNPISLTITNSDIDHRYDDSTKNYAMIVHGIVSSGYEVDPKVTVIINNSDIVTQHALAEAYRGHHDDFNNVIDTAAAQKSNMKVYLNKASLVAKTLENGEIKSGSIIFYEDVRTNIADTSCVAFITELSKAKTSDGMTPYLYTSHDYGSVTWSNGNVELWASGSLPSHETCKFDNAVIVEKNKEYNYTATSTNAPFKFLVNLTLSNEIAFNFYVPVAYEGTEVYLDGKLIPAGDEITYVDRAASDCYNYSVSFAPHEAAKEFTVSMVTPGGVIMTRKISVGLYAESLMKQINANPNSGYSVRNKELLGAALSYIIAAGKYSGVNTDLTTVQKIYSSCKVTVSTPSGTDHSSSISLLNDYFTGVQINADTSSKFRFNVKHGANISDLTFSVDGSERSYTIAANGSYVELDLRAYEMTHDITISVGGKTATYNLYTYYTGLATIAGGSSSATQKEAAKALEFIKTLYNYANIADKHLNAPVQ